MKRFTETDKWQKNKDFRKLSIKHKLLWLYLVDFCDNSGVFEFDSEMVSFCVGAEYSNEDLKVFGDKIELISEDKYFIRSFVNFQFGQLNVSSNLHKNVIKLLQQHEIYDKFFKGSDTLNEGLIYPIGKGKGISKGISKGKGNKKKNTFTPPTKDELKAFCEQNGYGNIADQIFNYYSVADWVDSKGNKVRNWKQKLISVWFKESNKAVQTESVANSTLELMEKRGLI